MSNTHSIFSELELELARQDVKHGPIQDDGHGPVNWFNIIHEMLLDLPVNAKSSGTPITFRRGMVKIAATCINCIKSIDRLFPSLPGVK